MTLTDAQFMLGAVNAGVSGHIATYATEYLIVICGAVVVFVVGAIAMHIEDEGMRKLDGQCNLDRKDDPADDYWCPGCGEDWNGAFNTDRRCVTCGRYVLEIESDDIDY